MHNAPFGSSYQSGRGDPRSGQPSALKKFPGSASPIGRGSDDARSPTGGFRQAAPGPARRDWSGESAGGAKRPLPTATADRGRVAVGGALGRPAAAGRPLGVGVRAAPGPPAPRAVVGARTAGRQAVSAPASRTAYAPAARAQPAAAAGRPGVRSAYGGAAAGGATEPEWVLEQFLYDGQPFLIDPVDDVVYTDCRVDEWPTPVGRLEGEELMELAHAGPEAALFGALDDYLKHEHVRFLDLFAEFDADGNGTLEVRLEIPYVLNLLKTPCARLESPRLDTP